jgi:uncharacterized repeat protein (TIGR02543 family)
MKRITLFAIAAIFLLTLTTRSATAQQQQRPGNISTNSTLIAWFTPENYQNGTWTNRITSSGTIGNLTQPTAWSVKTPPATTTGNFHPAVMFSPTALSSAPHRMVSTNNFTVGTEDAFTFILVYRPQTPTWDDANILNFSDVTTSASNDRMNVSYASSGSNVLSFYWPNGDRRSAFGTVPSGTAQLVTIDNNNSTAVLRYLGGTYLGYDASAQGAANNTLIVGSSRYNLASDGRRSFKGDIQELIILKRNKNIYPYLSSIGSREDLNRIHSYLAIKYGISMPDSNYLASDATTVVWDRTVGAGYNSHIFGIARDDGYGLCQKQSQNTAFPFLTAFVGNSLATLNSNNISGQLDNNVYVLFGSNGGNINTIVTFTAGNEISVPGSGLSINYRRELVYKAQLKGAASSLKIKFKIDTGTGILPEYVLVSGDPTFPAASTQAIPITGSIAEAEISDGSYIAFGGHTTGANEGPGGVSANLKLWLRADDAASITTEVLPVSSSTAGKVYGYPDAATGSVLGVTAWKDHVPARNHTYSYAAAAGAVRHLEPVYQPSNHMTNFHPALRFWSIGASSTSTTSDAGYATWLANPDGIWPDRWPTNNKHSAFFVVNSSFSTYQWAYMMMFSTVGLNSYRGPGYGLDKNGSNMVGRFRTDGSGSNSDHAGARNLFSFGATSILGYHATNTGTASGNNINVLWRFNGMEDHDGGEIENGHFGLNQASIIGGGYRPNRTIHGVLSEVIMYDDALPANSLQLIESYLALKYGITLTPSPNPLQVNRFDYKFSDGATMLWNGTATGTKWATFYNRVAAVIRDDASGLYNRQSHSTNVGSILHMGVAGTRLGKTRPDPGNFPNDMEAVIWGDDGATGVTEDTNVDRCGDYQFIFNRKWLVHKVTEGDRPVRMIVGAENNIGNQLGDNATAEEKTLYSFLTEGYDVCMIVADAPEELAPGGKFTAVVPMRFIDGEHQCIYTFADPTAYITFAYRPKTAGCTETAEFEGTKTFKWTQWTRKNYGTAVNGAGIAKGAFDLGDGVQVTGTGVAYGDGVIAPAYYPSVTGSPVAGSLYLRRKNGGLNDSKITVTVNLNTPVRPEFSICDIDGYYGRYEQVTVTGYCGSGGVFPTLSYAGNPASSYYRIAGNTATATERRSVSTSNKNGQLNVSFREGVTRIVIEFAITGRPQSTSTHDLVISPIRLRQVPPPPPVNEDGLSFVKDVSERNITTCEPVEYSFYIGNTNCEEKLVSLRDTLPPGLKWADVGTETDDPQISFNDCKGTAVLHIDNLPVPGSTVLRVTATAMVDDGFVPAGTVKLFDNHAWAGYGQIVNSVLTPRVLRSIDRETHADETRFSATGTQRRDTVRSTVATGVNKYSADSVITVTLTVANPAGNGPLPSSWLDVSFGAGFTYVAGSFASTGVTPAPAVVSTGDSLLLIAYISGGDTTGFEIPPGESACTFKLKAPALAGLVREATGEVSPLQIEYIFSSETADPCIISAMTDVSGWCEIPYKDLIANDDRAPALTGIEVTVPVLDNDSIPPACPPKVEIITPPLHGNAGIENDTIRYTSFTGYAGHDTLAYRISCNGDTATARVYVYAAEKPDNISDADCYVSAHQTVWDMEKKAVSDAEVFWLATPFAGDLDGDGRVEVVAPGIAVDDGENATSLLVFDDSLKLIRTVTPENGRKLPNINTMTFLIADVDNDGKGEIVTATTLHTLLCFSHDGAERWETAAFTPAGNPGLITADIDSDGHAEILAGNSIYAGESGKLLVTLPAGGRGGASGGPAAAMPVFADIDSDGLQEVVAGNTVYKVTLNDRNGTAGNKAEILAQINLPDGFTSVADIDLDGDPDVIVTGGHATTANTAILYVWDGATPDQIGQTLSFPSTDKRISRAFAGDIDGDGRPDIAFTFTNRIAAYSFDPHSRTFAELWTKTTSDKSGATAMSMFDFDQNGRVELVYRDMDNIRIINGQGNNITALPCYSSTHTEYPVVVDLDRDGHADILVSGSETAVSAGVTNRVRIMRYGSRTPGQWASARSVWNQHAYNATNINDDLSVPRYPVNPARAFAAGPDGLLNTPDDRRPYNAFLQQQTTIDATGLPVRLTPDAVADPTISSAYTVTGNTVAVRVGIINRGDAALGPPVYVTLYRDFVAPDRKLAVGSEPALTINRGDTGYVTVPLNMDTLPVAKITVRVNDSGTAYPYQPECDSLTNNTMEITLFKPTLGREMKKDATLLLTPPAAGNGTYPNPVSILYGEEIEYRITAMNANPDSGTVIIRDTLPAYLRYVPGSEDWSPKTPCSDFKRGTIPGPPERDTLMFRFDSLKTLEPVWAIFRATPASGASASQPMFVNRAWVTAGDVLHIPTGNSTYHQGAGVSTVTFSAPAKGGDILNAAPQALDYRTAPRTGVLIVPGEGYTFAGWSHDAYLSLRGERIEARAGVKRYDTLTIYGSVELRAVFVAEEYPVRYYLHGGKNAATNPPAYTVESAAITLAAPHKPGDIFTGWTGSNGDEPQPSVTIPRGSTGERDYYANYLHTGREEPVREEERTERDRIWASGAEACIRTSRPGSIVRIYTPEGVLREQRTLLSAGTAKIRLAPGVHIITLNNSPGRKIMIKP